MEFNQPVPELPVSDVEKAQDYYQRRLGFKIEWLYPSKEVGAVSNGDTAIFFRKREGAFEPAVNWVYCGDLDRRHVRPAAELLRLTRFGLNVIQQPGNLTKGDFR